MKYSARKVRHPRFGLTILELVVVCIVITVIIALLVPVAFPPRRGGGVLKCKTQLKQIHQAMLVYAEDNNGRLPLPGLIRPLTGADGNVENVSLNHSAPLYSAMIALQLINTAIVISPQEVNGRVEEMQNYDFNSYDPNAGTYWDSKFAARIDQDKPGSNTSYAHMALCGERKIVRWRDDAESIFPMLSTRGPEDGATVGDKYTKSLTLQLQDPEDIWIGNVVFADNHVEYIDSFERYPFGNETLPQPFNFFRMDGGALGVSISSTADDVERIWDPLQ